MLTDLADENIIFLAKTFELDGQNLVEDI